MFLALQDRRERIFKKSRNVWCPETFPTEIPDPFAVEGVTSHRNRAHRLRNVPRIELREPAIDAVNDELGICAWCVGQYHGCATR